VIYLGEKPTLKTGMAAMLLIAAVVIAFWDEGRVN